MEGYVPGTRNLDGTGRRARAFAGLLLAGAALLLLQALSAPGTPRVYRFSLFFLLFPAVLLLLESAAGFSALRGMARSGGGFVTGPGGKDPVVLDRRRANLLLVAAFMVAVGLGALLVR